MFIEINMSGPTTEEKKLNYTLELAIQILNENNLNNWFIFFGTLLGIVRNNSCIQGDDDIDIVINNGKVHDKKGVDQIFDIFESNGFEFIKDGWITNKLSILKTKATKELASIDFYRSDVNECGDFYIAWHGLTVGNTYINKNETVLLKKKWGSTFLNLPSRPEERLESLYGNNWKTPMSLSWEQKTELWRQWKKSQV